MKSSLRTIVIYGISVLSMELSNGTRILELYVVRFWVSFVGKRFMIWKINGTEIVSGVTFEDLFIHIRG